MRDTPARFAAQQCPHCGKRLDAASVLEGPVPKPRAGDLTVCLGCGEAMRFDKRLRLKRMTAAEIAALAPEEALDLQQTQTIIRAFIAADH